MRLLLPLCLLLGPLPFSFSSGGKLPMVINTWPFVDANKGGKEGPRPTMVGVANVLPVPLQRWLC